MSLTEKQIDLFHTSGYAIVPDLFTRREIRAMRAELDRFKRDGLLRNVATDGDASNINPLCVVHSLLFRRALA